VLLVLLTSTRGDFLKTLNQIPPEVDKKNMEVFIQNKIRRYDIHVINDNQKGRFNGVIENGILVFKEVDTNDLPAPIFSIQRDMFREFLHSLIKKAYEENIDIETSTLTSGKLDAVIKHKDFAEKVVAELFSKLH